MFKKALFLYITQTVLFANTYSSFLNSEGEFIKPSANSSINASLSKEFNHTTTTITEVNCEKVRVLDVNQFLNLNQSYDQTFLDNLFDGKVRSNKNDVHIQIKEEYFNERYSELESRIMKPKEALNLREPVHIIEGGISYKQEVMGSDEKEKALVENAFKILSEIPLYSGIFAKLKSKVNIFFDENMNDYGKALPGFSFLGLSLLDHTIEISAKYKDTLWRDPVYLAITIAHELFHIEDFEGGLKPKEEASIYAMELKAHLGQVYVYEYLKSRYPDRFKITPQSKEEISRYLKQQEFYRDIILFKEGKKVTLNADDYKPLKTIGGIDIKEFIKKIEDDKDSKGVFSFNAFVVLGYFVKEEVNFETALKKIKKSIQDNREGFNRAIGSARKIYIDYSNLRGIECGARKSAFYCGSINLDEIPEFLNESNSNQNQPSPPSSQTPSYDDNWEEPSSPPSSNEGEIGVTPPSPPAPIPINPNWDGQ
jgi:hypothetical protein